MFQRTEEVRELLYVNEVLCLPNVEVNHLVLPLLFLSPLPMIVSVTINSGTICFCS